MRTYVDFIILTVLLLSHYLYLQDGRATKMKSQPALPAAVAVTKVGGSCGCANRDGMPAFVAEGDLLLTRTTVGFLAVVFRFGRAIGSASFLFLARQVTVALGPFSSLGLAKFLWPTFANRLALTSNLADMLRLIPVLSFASSAGELIFGVLRVIRI